MNDYWNYLAHGDLGKERKGHKYYARVAVGRNKLGFTQYRYFYDAREYGAYMTRQKNNRYSPKFEGKKKGKSFISSLFGDNPKITMLKDMDGKSVKKYIAGKK